MATSTIFTNVVLESEEDVKRFLNAMEQSQNDKAQETNTNVKYVENEDEIRTLFARVVKTKEDEKEQLRR